MTRVRLVPLQPEPPDGTLVDWLSTELASALGIPVAVDAPLPDVPEWRGGGGSQLDSSAIVSTLIERYPVPQGAEGDWVLGLTAADLRGGGRDFVFGEATVGGFWAVIGTARFGAPGEQRFRPRVLKEALHELGHVAGLEHCDDPACLMAPSRDLAELDRKGFTPCRRCRTKRLDTEP